nr:retrovirus-related Pol polyprotein from transposon 17.6 [Tanacetum cinerariifolium]
MVKALLLDKKSQNQAPATVKAVEESCVTYGGAHSYFNYNQGNTSYRPLMLSNQIRPPSFPLVPNNQNVQLNQRNSQNRFNQNQNRGNNFNQGPVYQPSVFQPLAYQAPAYQASAPQTQGVSKEDFSAYVKANDAVMRNMQNQLTNLTELLTKFMNTNSTSTSSSGTLPRNTIANSKSDLKAITTRSGVSYDGPQIPPPPFFFLRWWKINQSRQRTQCILLTTKALKTSNPSISFGDALILMPKFRPSIKSLLTNKDKLCELSRTPLNEHCSSVPLKKLPKKLGDPGKFLIPYDFLGKAECLALADLGASINLMPLSVWNKLSLPNLTPMCMTLEIADHSITRPVGFAKDVYIKVGTFHFQADFIVVDFDVNPQVPLILGRSFLQIGRALIDVFEEYLQDVLGFSDVIASGNPTPYYDPIVSTIFLTLTPFGNNDFLLEEVDAFLSLEDDPTSPEVDQFYLDSEGDILLLEAFLNYDPSLPPPNQGNYMPEVHKELKICEAKSDKSLIDEPLEVELKDLPPHLEYAFLEGDDKLPAIIAKDLKDFEPAVQHQRRVNLKIYDVIKQEVLKLLDAGLIYPISDNPRVSPVYCVQKKGGFIVVENKENELVLTRLVTGWRVCIEYRKLNEATHKDHFPLPFMDQMLERLAGNQHYYFLDGFSGYFQILIDLKDQEKTIFTYLYGMFTYRRLSFGLCNAPARFRERMLKRCEDTNLCLNWEKSHFMVKEGIVLGNKISKEGTKVDKAKVDVITKSPHPTTVKGMYFLSEEFPDIDSFDDIHPHFDDDPLSGSTTYSANSLLEEFADELALISYPPDYDDYRACDIESDIREIEFFLFQEIESDATFDDDSFDSEGEKIKEAELLIDSLDLPYDILFEKVQLNELRDQAYENSPIYKEKTKRLNESKIKDHVFNIGDRVLLFNSRLKIFSSKLKSRWSGPFTISHIFSYGTVELAQPDGPNFKVNGHHLKHYFREDVPKMVVPDL